MIAGPVQTTPALAMRAAITEFEDVAKEIAAPEQTAPIADAAPAGNDAMPSNDASPAVTEDAFRGNIIEWDGELSTYEKISSALKEKHGGKYRVSSGQVDDSLGITGYVGFKTGEKVDISNPMQKEAYKGWRPRRQSPAESMRSALDDIGSITAEPESGK